MSNFPRFSVFSPCSRSYIVHFSFSTFFTVSRHIPGLTLSFSHFPSFSVFLAIFLFIQCLCIIFYVFQFCPHNPGPTVFISDFPRFSVFLDKFQVLLCDFLIFFPGLSPYSRSYSVQFSFSTLFSVSRHIPGHTVFVSHFPRFSVFSPYSWSSSVLFSFFTFSVFLEIFHDLQYVFHIFHDFHFSHHIPGPTVCIFYFPCAFLSFYVFSVFCLIPDSIVSISHFLRFSMFLAIFQILYRALLIFQVFSVFLTIFLFIQCLCIIFYVFQFFHHNPGPTVFISDFPCFSVFLAIFQVLPCDFLIFFFRYPGLSPYARSYSVHFSFSSFFSVSRHIQVIQCFCLLFHLFKFSRHIPGPTV